MPALSRISMRAFTNSTFRCNERGAVTETFFRHDAEAAGDLRIGFDDIAQILADQTARSIAPIDLVLRTMQEKAMESSPTGDSSWNSYTVFQDLNERLKNLTGVDALLMVGADGRLANDSHRYPAPPDNLLRQDYFEYLSKHNDHTLYISPPARAPDNGGRHLR